LKSYILENTNKTVVITDHKPLISFFKNKEPNNARQARWCLTVSTLGVEIQYQMGKKNVLADALSRMKKRDNSVVLATKLTSKEEEELLSKTIKDFINELFINLKMSILKNSLDQMKKKMEKNFMNMIQLK